ncbi:MAG TPA: cupin domain-containing protein [Methanoregula sp.]|nr:cupin domain-containing protein [Methanoregula sp.]
MSCIDTETIHEHNRVVSINGVQTIEKLEWNPHPKFEGVFLKHLVKGSETGGRMSLHHVRIYPGCRIGDHSHAGQVEIHDIISGDGTCVLAGTEIPYCPGVMGVMPADTVHRVIAGDRGLLLLATFSPPLV